MTIEEYMRLVQTALRDYPLQAEETLQMGTKKMVKAIRANTPVGKAKHPHKLKKSWRTEMAGTSGASLESHIYSTAPHFHLVERGYTMKDAHGHVKGYRNGRFFMANTVMSEGPGIQQAMGDELAKELGDKLG